MITSLVKKMEDNISQAKEKAKSFFNACSPDSPDGPIDHQFQAQIIDCTADDQKNIRTRLSILIDQIERTQNYIESL
ncbi:unnamed protein product [Thelazia callipaeda]|uniref:Mediator of RNA polymerase II transcription subunit 21 n=1 Tax=Thelazia callipaeda TaxID=103827 RepID=A0A0N5DB45_THECL|nr:unnamed protein product [Thelazia callipaeda]